MKSNARRLPLPRLLWRFRRLLGLEGRGSGALGRGVAPAGIDRLSECRSYSHSGRLSQHPRSSCDGGRSSGVSSGVPCTASKQSMAHPAGSLSGRSSPGSHREACGSGDGAPRLCISGLDLGVANDCAARLRHLVPGQASESAALRSALETFLAAEQATGRNPVDLIFSEFGSLNDALAASPRRLIKTIGRAATERLLTFRDLNKLVLTEHVEPRPWLSIEEIAAVVMMEIGYSSVEIVCAIYLDAAGCISRFEQVTIGTATTTLVDARSIIVRAVEEGASALIIAHNHPSGNPRPSRADRLLTDKLTRMCADFDLRLIDHLIVGRGRAYSVRRSALIDCRKPQATLPHERHSTETEISR